MTLEDSIHIHRLRVLREAEQLGNVSAACRRHGMSRTLFYRLRQRLVDEHAAELLPGPVADPVFGDDRLELMFACCHPSLAPEVRVALTLRYLQTMLDISTEKSSTILFPVPIDLMAAFRDHLERGAKRSDDA